jgi:CubicO group peptidase (beta-lactamase class C family)
MVRREPKHLIWFLGLGLLLVLAACGPAAPVPESVTDPVPETEAGPAATSTPVPPGVLSPKDLAAFDFVVEKKIEAVPLAGLTLGIRWGSEPPYVKGYGIADAATSVPATQDTIYQIASLTKQFTAAAIMQLVEQDRLALDEPITEIFPQAPGSWQGITVRHLLNHTSGLPDVDELARAEGWLSGFDGTDELIAALYDAPLWFDPGSQFKYGDTGYRLLAGVIEAATGLASEEYIQQEILVPLGLNSTFACHERLEDLAQGHEIANRTLVPVLAYDPSPVVGSSGLCSSAGDLIEWQDALASGRVVSPDSYRQMTTPTILADGTSIPYGYALGLDAETIAHGGAVPGFRAWMIHYPDEDLALVLLSNTNVPPNYSLDILAQVIADRILGRTEQ